MVFAIADVTWLVDGGFGPSCSNSSVVPILREILIHFLVWDAWVPCWLVGGTGMFEP